MSLTTLTTALLSHDSEPSCTILDPEAARWDTAIAYFIFYAWGFPTLTCQNVFFEKDLLNPKSLLILKMPWVISGNLHETCSVCKTYGDSSSMVWNRCQKRLRKAFQILYKSSRYAVLYSPQGQVWQIIHSSSIWKISGWLQISKANDSGVTAIGYLWISSECHSSQGKCRWGGKGFPQ